ncbi:uncharacterized protein PRCAT00000774001 [Priceomyces carsonii]|uniref:uncharacterized protein n=1 Tax=Priceomyces carsonii TaxID=28549 RepID=UPI002EDB92DB|nr:unnamed protein product [Priceomyces carsonii]
MSVSEENLHENSQAAPRRVARRACLSCRKKKIKCEVPPSNDDSSTAKKGKSDERKEGRNNDKVACTNCSSLGIECVFVRSNRGGRRKKRQLGDVLSSESPLISNFDGREGVPASVNKDRRLSPFDDSSNFSKESGVERISSYMFDGEQSKFPDFSRLKPLSPTLSYLSSTTDGLNRLSLERSSRSEFFPRAYEYHNMYQPVYQHPINPPGIGLPLPLPPPPPSQASLHHMEPHYPHPYSYPPPLPPHHRHGPPPHHMHYESGPPHHLHHEAGPPAHHMHHPHHPHHPHHHRHHHRHHHPSYYTHLPHSPRSPPSEPHDHIYGMPMKSPRKPPSQASDTRLNFLNNKLKWEQNPQLVQDASRSQRQSSIGFGSELPSNRNETSFMTPGSRHAAFEKEKNFDKKGYQLRHSYRHLENEVKNGRLNENAERMRAVDKGYEKVNLPNSDLKGSLATPDTFLSYGYSRRSTDQDVSSPSPSVSTSSRSTSLTSKAGLNSSVIGGYSDVELAEYQLPPWKTLNKLIDFYYTYYQIRDQLFPSKEKFLKNFSLVTDSSLLHAMIAIISHNVDEDIESDELYWIARLKEYWDNLTDFGMLWYYSLLLKTPSYKNDMPNSLEAVKRIWELIQRNNYFETLKGSENLVLNARQRYERDIIIRLMWIYLVNKTIFLRFKEGYPYYRLSIINPDYKVAYDLHNFTNSIPLPANGFEYLNIKSDRSKWDRSDSSELSIEDSTAAIYCLVFFENILNKISNNELTEFLSIDRKLVSLVTEKVIIKKVEQKQIIINSTFLFTAFAIHEALLLQNLYPLTDLIIFKSTQHKFGSLRSGPPKKLLLLDNISIVDKFDLDKVPSIIDNMDDRQWISLVDILANIKDIVDLIELDPNVADFKIQIYANYHENVPIDDFTDVKQVWLKYTDFALVIACSLIPIMISLIVLTKFISFEGTLDGVLATYYAQNARERLENDRSSDEEKVGKKMKTISVDAKLLDVFEIDVLLKKLSNLIEFIKTKLSFDNDEVAKDTMLKINKVSHYLEELLNSL